MSNSTTNDDKNEKFSEVYYAEHDGYKHLKEKLIDLSAYSTMHGIPRMFGRTHLFIKITWFSFVILSWTVCFYFIIKMILQYLQHEFNVNVELIPERPIRFPSIDICNLSPYDGETIEAMNLTFDLNSSMPDYPHMDDPSTDWYKYKVYESQFANDNKRKKEFDDILALKYVKIKADGLIRSKLNEFEIKASKGRLNLSEIGFHMKDMLLSCKFQGRYCSVNDFTMYHNYYYGNCFRFNGGRNTFNQRQSYKKIIKPGWRYGFQLELFTGRNGILSLKNGFRILVNNQTELGIWAFPEEEGFDVSPGFITHIAIEKTLVERLSSPYNDCMDNLKDSKFDYLIKKSEIIQVMKNVLNMTRYDQKLCLKMCLQKFIMENCNCTDFTLPNYLFNQTNTGCRSLNELICSSYSEAEFFYTNAINQCVQNCPDKCTFTRYNTKISTSKYPSHWFVKSQNISISQEEYNNFVAVVNIFFDDMLYTRISQAPLVTRETLFGNLGGTFGKLANFLLRFMFKYYIDWYLKDFLWVSKFAISMNKFYKSLILACKQIIFISAQ
jgi:hypothetical protein